MNSRDAIDGDTLGMEYENDSISANTLSEISKKMGWYFTHDASAETPTAVTAGGIPIVGRNLNQLYDMNLQKSRLGGEILSPVLTLEDFEKITVKFLSLIENAGSQQTSERSGIHFHISCQPSLTRLINAVKLAAKFEPVFYYFGGMGYKFRGMSNDSIYCRPITGFGPPCVPVQKDLSILYGQVFDVHELIKTTQLTDFWDRYGDSRRYNRRYTQPARYSWINFFSANPHGDSYHGTMEFRVFNFSLNPVFLVAAASVCQRFVQKIISSSYNSKIIPGEIEENSIIGMSKGEAKLLFAELMEFLQMDDSKVYILEKIFELTPEIYLRDGFVMTHKSVDGIYFNNQSYTPKLIPYDIIRKPHYVDIHTLGG